MFILGGDFFDSEVKLVCSALQLPQVLKCSVIKSIAPGICKQFTTCFFKKLFYLAKRKKRRIPLLSDYVIFLLCLQLSMGA